MNIRNIFLAALLMFSGVISSCSLITDKPLTAEQQDALDVKRKELIDRIEKDYPDSNYLDDEVHLVQLLRLESINLIYEEDNIDNLESLYSRLVDNLDNVLTKEGHFCDLVDLNILETLCDSDKTYVEDKYDELKKKAQNTQNINEIKELVEEFSIYVSFFIGQEYKKEQIKRIQEYFDAIEQSLYYDFLADQMNRILSSYAQKIDLCSSYDAAEDLAEEAKLLLEAVQTKEEYDLGKVEEAKQYVSSAFANIVENAVVSSSQMSAINSWSNETLTYIENLTNSNEILTYFVNSALQMLSDLGIDLDVNLNIFKEIKNKQLEALYLKFLDYREDDYTSLEETLANCSVAILSAINKDEVISKWNEANTDLQAIKTNEQRIALEDESFNNELNSQCGTYVVDKPSNQYNINYYYQLAEIIDYYLFYQKEDFTFVQDEFRVKVNFPYISPRWVRNEVYWYCSLLRGSADMYFERENEYFVVKLIGYEQSTKEAEFTPITKRQDPSYFDNGGTPTSGRADDFDDFECKLNVKKAVCWNSQQLCYALEKGYCPVPKAGSVAEQVLNRAKEILLDIVEEGMDDTEKIYEIYSWLGRNASLDMDISKYNYSSDMDERPSENLALYRSYYAESALFDGHTVCDGYAKAYGLMLALEGIQSKRILCKSKRPEINTINTSTNAGTGHHEVTYVELDGNTYCTDPTRSSANTNRSLLTWNHVLFPTQYQHDKVLMRCNQTIDSGKDYKDYILKKLKIAGVSMFVNNKTELAALINAVPTNLENYQFEILFTDEYANCKEDFMSFGLDFEFNEFYTDEHIKGLIVYPE